MPDPATPSPDANKKPRKAAGPLDSATLAQLQKDEGIVLAVQKTMATDPAFTAAVADYYLDGQNNIKITPSSVDDLVQQIASARKAGQAATSGSAEFHDITQHEKDNKGALRDAIHAVQARAKNKYEESNPSMLKSYYVGERFDSRSDFEQAAAAIYELIRTTDDAGNAVTPKDTLPNLTAPVIAALKAGSDAYRGFQTDQTKAQLDASDARFDLI